MFDVVKLCLLFWFAVSFTWCLIVWYFDFGLLGFEFDVGCDFAL